MLRSLWLLFLYVSFVGLSTSAPFVSTLGYVWVDTFQPQAVAYILLNQFPVAMTMGIVAVGSYLLMDRRSAPPVTLQTVLQVFMAIWITASMLWAVAPDVAWAKWDWAFKTIVFTTFIPYAIRSRVQIEAFAQTYVFSLAANFVPFGIKVLISGGGYGVNLGLVNGNMGLSEGGFLSTSCLMAVPLTIYLAGHNTLIPKYRLLPLAYWGIAALSVATAIGTYERSALIGLIVLGIYMWVRTKHKVGFGIVLFCTACAVIYATSGAWNARISTIGAYQEDNSAMVRVLVWKWTLEFVGTHPFGGGFLAYVINHVDLPGGGVEFGRAFHSIYFEVLGEQGFPGFAMFILLAGSTIFALRRAAKQARPYPELQWVIGLSDALQSGLAVFLSSGAFVGLAFQPMFWYFIAMSVCVNAYMWRVMHQSIVPETGWRALTVKPEDEARGKSDAADWRKRPSRPILNSMRPGYGSTQK